MADAVEAHGRACVAGGGAGNGLDAVPAGSGPGFQPLLCEARALSPFQSQARPPEPSVSGRGRRLALAGAESAQAPDSGKSLSEFHERPDMVSLLRDATGAYYRELLRRGRTHFAPD